MQKFSLSLFSIICLTGCATGPFTIPVAMIGQDGRVLTGTNTVSREGGSFTVSDGKLTCSGSYDPFVPSATIAAPVVCNDGRKGIVRATRDTAFSGSGTVRMNNGYQGDFIFGKAAENF